MRQEVSFPYQVVLDGGSGDWIVLPLPLVDEVAVQPILPCQKQSLSIFFLLHLWEQQGIHMAHSSHAVN